MADPRKSPVLETLAQKFQTEVVGLFLASRLSFFVTRLFFSFPIIFFSSFEGIVKIRKRWTFFTWERCFQIVVGFYVISVVVNRRLPRVTYEKI